jgi:hypothetical protein
MKDKQILVKIEDDLYTAYKELCKVKGYNMSQRIRNFIETELNDAKEA